MTATPITDWLADVDLEADVALDAEAIDLDAGELDALKRADWHLRHIAAIDRQVEQLQAIYEAELARLEERLESRLVTLGRARVWHEAPCLALHEVLLARQPKRKTISLTAGALKATVGKVHGVAYDDEAVFVEWAKTAAPELVPPKYMPDKNAVKKAFNVRETDCPACGGGSCDEELFVDGQTVRCGSHEFESWPEDPTYAMCAACAHVCAHLPCPTCGGRSTVERWVTDDGEVVPGIVPVPPSTTYRVDVAT